MFRSVGLTQAISPIQLLSEASVTHMWGEVPDSSAVQISVASCVLPAALSLGSRPQQVKLPLGTVI